MKKTKVIIFGADPFAILAWNCLTQDTEYHVFAIEDLAQLYPPEQVLLLIHTPCLCQPQRTKTRALFDCFRSRLLIDKLRL